MSNIATFVFFYERSLLL